MGHNKQVFLLDLRLQKCSKMVPRLVESPLKHDMKVKTTV